MFIFFLQNTESILATTGESRINWRNGREEAVLLDKCGESRFWWGGGGRGRRSTGLEVAEEIHTHAYIGFLIRARKGKDLH